MLENAAQSDSRPRRLRAAVTNDPLRLRGLDARSRTGRRRADLIVQFTAALGGRDRITEGQLVDVVRAAELVALAEEARLTALKGDSAVDLVGLVRLEGVADRAVRRLGLDHKREPPSAPDLATYLRALKSEAPPAGASPAAAPPPERDAEPTEAVDAADEGRRLARARPGDHVRMNDGTEVEIIPDNGDDG
jgi:hypothetical protein